MREGVDARLARSTEEVPVETEVIEGAVPVPDVERAAVEVVVLEASIGEDTEEAEFADRSVGKDSSHKSIESAEEIFEESSECFRPPFRAETQGESLALAREG